ncbi:PAS domain-containing protein [Larkinella sp. VNQ87]|uniref:PAS domain-containing protein n=1 Tax=Larkinella sp. VNQ87 TaxID=3400921 RepID=UPI003BFC419F
METNHAYTDYLQQNSVATRPFPVASLEIFLLDRAQERHHRREVERLQQLAEAHNWRLTRDYEKALYEGYTLIVSNMAQSILWASHGFLAMTGYKPAEVVGRTPRFLQGPGTDRIKLRQLAEDLMRARFEKRPQPIRQQLINYRKGGTPYFCEIEIDPIQNRQGELTHFIAVEREV